MSIEHLSPFWQKVCHFNPVFYLINGFRYAVIGESDVSLTSVIVVCFITLAVAYLMAQYSLKKGSFSRW